jgi:CRISPR system Cascade subunit CasC
MISERLEQQGHSDSKKAIIAALDASLNKTGSSKKAKAKAKSKADNGEPGASSKLFDKNNPEQLAALVFASECTIAAVTKIIGSSLDQLSDGICPPAVAAQIVEAFDTPSNSVDLALFGRMLATHGDLNVDAAVHYAHSLGANRLNRESDFFTAVDDFKRDEESGSAHLDSSEFNSSCHYRFASVNLDLLIKNLGGDSKKALKGLAAFIRSNVMAIPSARQSNFASYTLPAAVIIGVHDTQPVQFSNALENPVWHGEHPDGLTAATVARLQQHADTMAKAYGLELNLRALDTTGVWTGRVAPTLDDLINGVIAEVS